ANSQPRQSRTRAVGADRLPAQDRPCAGWGSGSWPGLRWQRSYPPNCARITSEQRPRSRRLSCPPGTWVMSVFLYLLALLRMLSPPRVVFDSLAELRGEVSGRQPARVGATTQQDRAGRLVSCPSARLGSP